ncbi:AIPR family protein [Nonomuraea sp. NPDC049646]|uniref:AIPR family protein n=1 Tax=unclassified Nonomuraea TaxID=2593643 RepID=UPI0037909912
MSEPQNVLPEWLRSYDAFSAHLDEELADENPHNKGLRFVHFAHALLPRIPKLNGFEEFELNKKLSHDGGVDILTAQNPDGSQLFAQSKYRIRRVDEIDSIISKFEGFESAYLADNESPQPSLFEELSAPTAPRPVFLVVTSSNLDTLIRKYRTSKRSSVKFFEELLGEERIVIADGSELLLTLQSIYRKSFEVPSGIEFDVKNWLHVGSVHLGVVSGKELIKLYDEHGDGLFFENIRSFLGLERNQDRESVNRKILKTVEELPEKMLERNNGITIRAKSVTVVGHKLVLSSASIVNGCQTTMCIVQRRDHVQDNLLVAVKVVESNDLWEVAHSANYQNRIRQIDLDLAKYLRPQLVQRAAARMGISVEPDASHGVTDLLATISDTQITYEETKALYKGIFSERPTNIFDNNYNKLLTGVLDLLYERDDAADRVFSGLFVISGGSRLGRAEVSRVFAETETQYFQRFKKPVYSAYISLLAAGAITSTNLADRSRDAHEEASRLVRFIEDSRSSIESNPNDFIEAYLTAYEILSEIGFTSITEESGDAFLLRDLYNKISATPYETFYNTLCMRLHRARSRQQQRPTNGH